MPGDSSQRSLSVPTYSQVPDSAYCDTDEIKPNEFIWNGRKCSGSSLHLAALEGDVHAVTDHLRSQSSEKSLQERFTYETVFAGKTQEGSGEAIHLAASRGHVEVVKTLLDARASLQAHVSRDNKPHFDVIHAATFAEGRGGDFDMIKHLIEVRAEMSQNLDQRYPLHIAYLTGNVPVIRFLRDLLAESGIGDEDLKEDQKVPLPLSLGISGGKMSEDQLSDSAELGVLSLTTFIHECPQCIPSFLKRYQDAEHVSAEDLAKNVTRFDMAAVLQESPEAAVALLETTTAEPLCANKGWHPLPSRVSFATRDWKEKVKNQFNPPRTSFTFYEKDHTWAFDSSTYVAPPWHGELTDRSWGRPIVDADIRVCHIPDLLCAEVFASLCDPVNEDADVLWNDPVVESMISHVFWNGSCRPELTWMMMTFWGLALLIAEEAFLNITMEGTDAKGKERLLSDSMEGRLLRPHAGANSHSSFKPMSLKWDAPFHGSATNAWVAVCWLACRAVADLYMEVMQFRGYQAIGRPSRYFAWDNLRDVFVSIIPILLFFDHTFLPLVILSVFLYWNRLLDCFVPAELFGNSILPIKKLFNGIGPALFVTGIAFCAFTHAFYLVSGGAYKLYPDVLLESFSSLITAALPADPDDVSRLKLLLVLGAIIYFSVFILNIFIGVIAEVYGREKERVKVSFLQVRASSGLQFLLRCKVLPCRLVSARGGVIVVVMSSCIALGVQLYCFFEHDYHAWVIPVFFACQMGIMLGSYQDPDSPWVAVEHGHEEDRYMWFCKQRSEEPVPESVPEPASTEEEAPFASNQDVKDLRESVDGMKNEMQFMLGQFEEVKSVLQKLKRNKKSG